MLLGVHFYCLGYKNLCWGTEKHRGVQNLQEGYILQTVAENCIHNYHHTQIGTQVLLRYLRSFCPKPLDTRLFLPSTNKNRFRGIENICEILYYCIIYCKHHPQRRLNKSILQRHVIVSAWGTNLVIGML